MLRSVIKQPSSMFSEECNLVKLENKYLNKAVFKVESSRVRLFVCNAKSELKTSFRVFFRHFNCGLVNMLFIVLSSR